MNATTAPGLDVICAFPVSGQYGPGARILYYVLVVACVLARKVDWVRNACLAGALLFPVVAAIHGVVLAAEHIPDAVDMDVFGAFQLCALGVLAAPVTVRRSQTYFNNKGRNIIFVWCLLVLAGLVSLTVEFYRINPIKCTHDNDGQPLSPVPGVFPYGNANCNLTCDPNTGPFSPLRGGSANNIYIIPAPTVLTFDAATLLAAACCVPGVLLLAAMWIKILEVNWRARFIEQTSLGERKKNSVAHMIRNYAEIVLFGAGVAAILIVGEMNLFSTQVDYETEPMANVGELNALDRLRPMTQIADFSLHGKKGQWAPIVGTGLAVFASLYILLAEALQEEKKIRDEGQDVAQSSGLIRRLARLLLNMTDYLGNPSADRFGDLDFRRGSVLDYPVIPGEELRNPELSRTRSNYDVRRDSKDSGVSHVSNMSRVRSNTVDSNFSRKRSATVTTVDSSFSRFGFDGTSTDRRTSSPAKKASPKRRDTLEVPAPVHHASAPNVVTDSDFDAIVATPSTPDTPAIVVSSNPDET